MKLSLLFLAAALAVHLSCGPTEIARIVKNIDLEKKGIHLKFAYVPPGLYEEPFIIKFDKMLRIVSNDAVQIMAYNIYTAGNFEKTGPESLAEISNFFDPFSKFKDSWFGVYIIMDDEFTMGRRFMLKNPFGQPNDIANFNEDSMLLLPKLDQKIIVWSTHEGQINYTWPDFEKDFKFERKKGAPLRKDIITDKSGGQWLRLAGSFDTVAALTDVQTTNMGVFSSIRNYFGLPDGRVYARVRPWHPITIKGTIAAHYFRCHTVAFWAVAYYNGVLFTDRQGKTIDTWENTGLRAEMEKMFNGLELDCVKKH